MSKEKIDIITSYLLRNKETLQYIYLFVTYMAGDAVISPIAGLLALRVSRVVAI
jgi:hypothetical protein